MSFKGISILDHAPAQSTLERENLQVGLARVEQIEKGRERRDLKTPWKGEQ
jgi:hypothetical protein